VIGMALLSVSQVLSQDAAKPPSVEAVQKVRAGNALYDGGKYEPVVNQYLSAITLAPDWYEAHYELGQRTTK
jgi:hypothetical protein